MQPDSVSDIDYEQDFVEQNRSVSKQRVGKRRCVRADRKRLVDFASIARLLVKSGRKACVPALGQQDEDSKEGMQEEQEEGQSTFTGWLELPTLAPD